MNRTAGFRPVKDSEGRSGVGSGFKPDPARRAGADSAPGGSQKSRLLQGTLLSRGLFTETLEPRLLMSADLIPVVGSIDVPGETDFYTFELAEERTILFDALTPDSRFNWSLSGPGGEVQVPTAFDASDGAQGGTLLALDAGTYRMAVDAAGDHRGDYQFRLINIANAEQIASGAAVSGVLEVGGRESDLFQFEAIAGQELFFDAQSHSGGTAYWQLVGPDGETVFGPRNFSPSSDPDRFVVLRSGTYTLLLEGYIYNNTDLSYSFALNEVSDVVRAVALDSLIEGTLAAAGQRHKLTFSLASDTRVFFDTLLQSNLQIQLEGPRGIEFGPQSLNFSDWRYDEPIHDLVAGDYTLTILGQSGATGSYGLQLLTGASAETLTYGSPVSGTLDDQGARLGGFRGPSGAGLAGDAGQAQRFDGNAPLVFADDAGALDPANLTVEGWFLANPTSSFQVLLAKSSQNDVFGTGYGLFRQNGRIVFALNYWFDEASSVSVDFPENEWHHIAATYDGAALRLYLDGVLAAEKAYAATLTPTDGELVLGANGDQDYRFNGQADEVRIWNVARSAEDIAASHTLRQAGPADGLVLAWGFDAQARAVPDLSGNGLAGRLQDGPGTETRLYRFSGAAGDRLVFAPSLNGSANLRLISPSGITLFGPEYSDVRDPLVLTEAGEYLVMIEGYPFEGRSITYDLLIMPETRQDLSLTVGERVDGTLATVGAAHSYGFSLSAASTLYFDALTSNRSDIVWSLTGPRGVEVTNRRFDGSDSYTLDSGALLALPPGDYTLIVDGTDLATGDYAFRLFDVASAAALTLGAPQEVVLDPSTSTAALRFAAEAGDNLVLQPLDGNATMRLMDPFGRQILGPDELWGGGRTILQANGLYLLLVEGYPDTLAAAVTATVSLAIDGNTPPESLTGTAMTLGGTVTGNIALPDELDDYLFTLTQPRRVLFDALDTADQYTYWSLVGPRGQEVIGRNFYNTDGYDRNAPSALDLGPGTYRLRIAKDASVTGSYSFRLLDLGQGSQITRGVETSGTLDPSRASAVFTFDADAGDELVLDAASQSGAGYGLSLRLLDPFGREVVTNRDFRDAGILPTAVAGRYTLIIEGRIYENAAGTTAFEFTLADRAVTSQALQIGETVSATVGSAQGRDEYTFTLTEQTDLIFDNLANTPSVQLQLLRGAQVLREFNLGGSDSIDTGTAPWLRLGPGDYTVAISQSYSQQDRPEYGFRFLAAAAAQTISLDTAVAGTLDTARQTRAYSFAGTAGTTVTFTGTSQSGAPNGIYLRVMDGFGREVQRSIYLQDGTQFVLPRDGTYTVLIEGRMYDSGVNPASFAFTLQTPVDPAPRAVTLNAAVTGEISRAGQVHRLTVDVGAAGLLYLDNLSNDPDLRVQITGPGGVSRSYNLRDADSVDFGGNPAFRVVQGQYQITVSAVNGAVGTYDFILRDLDQGTDITLGQTVQGTLSPARETDVYRFEGEIGDTFLMDVLREDGDQYGVYWRLIDPTGQEEVGRTRFQDSGLRQLKRSGTYTLLIEGRTYEPAASTITYEFNLQPAVVQTVATTLPAGSVASGLLNAVGPDGRVAQGLTGFEYLELPQSETARTDDVSFSLWFKADEPQDTWQPLVYKGGASVGSRQYTLWLNSSGYLHLTSSDASGQINIETPRGSIAWDTWNHVVGVVDRTNNQLRLYLNGVLSNQIALRDQPSVAVDQPLFLGRSLEDTIGFKGALAGFSLFGGAVNDAGAAALAQGSAVATPTIISLPMTDAQGAAVLTGSAGRNALVRDLNGGLEGVFKGRIEQAGEVDRYTFTMTEPTWLYWDTLTDRHDVRARLDGPAGVRIDRSLNQTGDVGSAENPVFLAPAGDYTLTFEASGAVKAAYGLHVLALGGAEEITFGTRNEGIVDSQRAAKAFVFDAVAGDRVFFDMESLGVPTSSAAWRLFDDTGQQILRDNARDIDTFELTAGGRYTLVLDGDRFNAMIAELPYRFTIYRVNTDPVPIAIGGGNPALAPVLVPGAVGGQAVDLRGAEHIEVPDDPALNLTGNVTTEAWIRLDRFGNTWTPILNKSDGLGGRTYDLWVHSNGSVHASHMRADRAVESINTNSGVIQPGVWAHVAVVRDRAAGQMRIYINGVLMREQGMSMQTGLATDSPLQIGWSREAETNYAALEGSVDDVRIWSTARTGAEIADTYQQALTGNEAGLVLYLPLDSVAAGGTTPDASPSGLPAMLVHKAPTGITGTVRDVGQQLLYTFTLDQATRVILDSLTNRSDLRYRLTGPAGVLADRTMRQADADGTSNPVLDLAAGDYELLVQGDGDARGDFNLILTDLAQAEPLTLGTPVEGVLAPANRTAAYKFTASAGQTVFLDNLVGRGEFRWRLIDPQGGVAFHTYYPGDFGGQVLARDGTYTLLIEGTIDGAARSSYRLAIYDQTPPAAQALVLGARTTADIAQPGQARSFAFTLDAPKRLLMDVFDNTSSVEWTLTGPTGTVVNARAFNTTDARDFGGNPLLSLAAGDYTLTVRPRGDLVGAFDFRLLDADAEAVEMVVNDEQLDGLPDSGLGTRVYRLDGLRHQSISMDVTTFPANNTAWRLIGPSGTQVIGVRHLRDEGPFILPESGSYLLLVEGSVADGTTTNTYRFEVTSPTGAEAAGATIEEFGLGSSIPHVLVNHAGSAAAEETAGADTVLRLLDPLSANQRNSISFGQTTTGRQETLSLAFDFAMTANGAATFGNGFGAFLVPSALYGRKGPVGAFPLEPTSPDVLAAVVDLVQSGGEGAVPHLSLHFGSKIAEVSLAGLGLDLAALTAGAGRMTMTATRAEGGARVSVTIDMGGGVVRVIDAQFVAGLELSDRRAVIQGDNGASNTMGLTVDNVAVTSTAATTALTAAPGDVLTGSLNVVGAVDRWRMVLTEPAAVVFDSLTNNGNLRWSLTGPVGNDAVGFSGTDGYFASGNLIRTLPVGIYEIAVSSANSELGSYRLALRDLADATPVTFGTAVAFTLDPGNSHAAFSFDWPGGTGPVFVETNNSGGPRAYWRLIGPDGTVWTQQRADVTDFSGALGTPGTYHLFYDGQIETTAPTNILLTVRRPDVTQSAMTLGGRVEGQIAAIGDTGEHVFTLTEPRRVLLDSLTNRSDLRFTLSGPGGTIWSDALQRLDSDYRHDAAVLLLGPGTYTATVRGDGRATGSYAFLLRDLDAATDLTPGATVDVTLDPGNAQSLFAFDGTAGETFYLDVISSTANGLWKVVNEFGQLTGSVTYIRSDMPTLTLTATGRHFLVLDPSVSDGTPTTQSFRLVPTAGTEVAVGPDTTIEGTIALPGQTVRHTFTLATPKTLFMDVLAPVNGNWTWTLTGPRGQVDGRNFLSSDGRDASLPPLYDLAAGDYVLTVSARNGVTGDYAFALLDTAQATPLTLGTTQSDQFAPGSETKLYSFTGEAGGRYFFDMVTGDSRMQWRLIDPFGREVFNQDARDVDTITLLDSGTYLLLVEGRIYNPEVQDFAFNVFANPVIAPVRLTLEDIPAPDLQVEGFALTSTDQLETGGLVPLGWTLRNTGDLALTGSFDTRITIRRTATGEILSDRVVTHTAGLAIGATLAQTASLRLPVGTRSVGDLTVTIRADANNAVEEQNDAGTAEVNNSADLPITVVLAAQPDLTLRDLVATPAAGWTPGQTVAVTWVVENSGLKEATAPWTERLTVTNRSTNRVVYSEDVRQTATALAAGDSLARRLEFGWPSGLDATGQYDFTVVADALGEIAEANDADNAEANNSGNVSIASAPDLVFESLSFDVTEATAGGTVTLSWVVSNAGAATTPGDWTDRVVLYNQTRGGVLRDVTVSVAGQRITAGGQVTRSVVLAIPHGLSGTGTLRADVYLDSDASGRSALNEARSGLSVGQAEENNQTSVSVTSVARPYADLVTTISSIPATGRGGEAATVRWRVENRGQVDTAVAGWTDNIYVSRDGTLSDDDILIGSLALTGALAVNAGYDGALDVTLPTGIEGNVRLLVVSDADRAVLEPDTRASNTASGLVALASPFADMVVQAVTVPSGSFVANQQVEVLWRVANLGPDAVPASAIWRDRVWLSSDATLTGADTLLGEFTRQGPLAKGASYSQAANIVLPPGFVGNFRIIVETNADDGIYERDAVANNARVGAGVLAIAASPSADLRVETVDGPDALVPGVTETVRWTVRNAGEAIARAPWQDGVYLVGPGLGGGQFLGEVARSFDLAVGATYEGELSVRIPVVGEGDYRIEVRTDFRSAVFEGGRDANNVADTGALDLLHPNLTIADLSLDRGTLTSGETVRVNWQVENTGSGAASGPRTDRVWLSRDGTLDPGDLLLASVDVAAGLAAGASAAAFADVAIPISASGAWFILVGVDAGLVVSEPGNEDDNQSSAALAVSLAPYADLEVTTVTAPALVVADPGKVEVTWTVANTGTGRGITDVWTDRIFISTDDVLGNGDDRELASFGHTGGLGLGASYTRTEEFFLPAALTGRFKLYVTTDSGAAVFENGQEADNTRALNGFFDVAPIPYADMVVQTFTAPEAAQSGGTVTLRWRVANQGIGLTNVSRWADMLYMANNSAGTGRTFVGNFDHIGFLAPGASYDREATITLPDGWEGDTYFFLETPGSADANGGAPFELVFTDAGNKATSNLVSVTLTPPPNLVVTAVSAPATAPEGSAIDVSWTVENRGTGPATGTWVDRVFLRKAGGVSPDWTCTGFVPVRCSI